MDGEYLLAPCDVKAVKGILRIKRPGLSAQEFSRAVVHYNDLCNRVDFSRIKESPVVCAVYRKAYIDDALQLRHGVVIEDLKEYSKASLTK